MQSIIALEVLTSVSESGFSLDELVMATRHLFEQEGMPGLIGLVLRLLDENLALRLRQNQANWKPTSCCGQPDYEFQDQPERRFRTSAGQVHLRWRRLRCRNCGRSTIPLREFLGLQAYQSQTAELEKMVMEVVSEQSYRRSSQHLETIGDIPVPKSTAHRWVVESNCDQMDTGTETFDQLFADGTGYKKRCNQEAKTSNRGELRIALGVDKEGLVVPLGSWSGESWEEIAQAIKGKRKDNQPVAEVLVSDGERGLSEALSDLCNEHQRCGWHFIHDLDFTLWQDGAAKTEREDKRQELISLIGIELPKEDFQAVSSSEREEIAGKLDSARNELEQLYNYLKSRGYDEAAGYVNRGGKNIFTYLERWLKTGLITPRVSSMIERMMREIARRLKRIAFGWSPAGAAKMARIIIKRFTSAAQWEKYWKDRLKIEGKVIMLLKGIKVIAPQPLGR
jgi:hypothetical protein